MLSLFVLPIFLQAAAVAAAAPAPPREAPAASLRVIRLDDAVRTALANQPSLQQARAQTSAAEGRATQARSPFFPQVTAIASYQHGKTGGVGGRAGATTTGVGGAPTALAPTDTGPFDVYTFGGTVSQLLWDWGTTYHRSRAANRQVESLQATEKTTSQNVVIDVRQSFFTARAQKALVSVSRDSLANLQRHLDQIQGFVSVGTRPEIDLAQARTDVANGQLQLITAENNYALARAQLGRAIGLPDTGDFDVADDELPAIDGEDLATERLVARAIASRPELVTLEKQRESNELLAKAFRGNYGPSLSASAGVSETGTDIAGLGPAWNVGVTLSWPIFQGGLTHGQVREATANADAVRAQMDTVKVQIRVDVQQAQLGIRAAKASQATTNEALTNARERLRLAEGRYASGVGTAIELGDAQLALTSASAQVVQAQYQLSSARAALLAALGQR
jgi:outer membrane protein